MLTWIAFGVGAAWALTARWLLGEASTAWSAWRRWRRSIYPAQVSDSETALFLFGGLLAVAGACTGGAAAAVLLLESWLG